MPALPVAHSPVRPRYFFQLHRALNSAVIVFTAMAFGMAIHATNLENLEHFRGTPESKHRPIGLIIVLFAVLQAVGGYARPHLPSTTPSSRTEPQQGDEEDKVEEATPTTPPPQKEEKSIWRKMWEVKHRVLGFTLLVLAWVNCTTGLDQFFLKFPNEGDVETWTAAFWAVAGGLAGSIAIGYGFTKAMKLKEQQRARGADAVTTQK